MTVKSLSWLVAALFATHALGSERSAAKRPVDWVDPQIGTAHSRWIFFSSACRPFGLVNLSPDTTIKGDWGAGYLYGDDTIRCFSHLHGWQLAGLAVMPVTGDIDGKEGTDGYRSAFSHDDEVVRAGYHKVVLKRYDVAVELTATTRVGFHRYRFPANQPPRVLIDTATPLMLCEMTGARVQPLTDRTGLDGYVTLGATLRRPKPLTLYFAIRFDRPFRQLSGWKDKQRLPDSPAEIVGPHAGAFVDFTASEKPLLMKVALSFTSIDGAKRNLAAEMPEWDFDAAVQQSADTWNDWLSRIEVEGGTDAQRTKFYTDLWHALLGRRTASDVDGSYIDNMGPAPIVRRVTPAADGTLFPHYNFDAWWGSQWTLDLLWPLAWPEVIDGFCQSMLDDYRNGGLIPRGPSGGNYTFVMIGDPATPVFTAAYQLGIHSWEIEKAYEGLRKNAFPGGLRDHAGYEHQSPAIGGGMNYYLERGYVPEGIPGKAYHRRGAAMTLEYAYQDWCLAQFARRLGKQDDAALFLKRAQNYHNIWNQESGWMQPRNLDGAWTKDFAPIGTGSNTTGFVESNSAIYSYFVPQDPAGLIELFGGPAKFIERLDGQFERAAPVRFIVPHEHHAEGWTDFDNEPGLGMPYWFNHAGAPWLTQKWVRAVHDAAFSAVTPADGYNGDEDEGQMGAFSALSAIGLFALDGCASINPHYELSAPLFDRVTIHLNPKYAAGKTFVITTRGNAKDNVYIQSATLNGHAWGSYRFPCQTLFAGGRLELELGVAPAREWGVAP